MSSVSTPGPRPASALPSVRARALAFAAILLAGVAGAAIGASFVSLQCHGNCTTPVGVGAVVGGAAAAGGTGVVASLTLRAMGEWQRISEEQLAGDGDGEGGADRPPGEPGPPGPSPGDGPARDPGDSADGPAGGQAGVRSRKPSA